MYYFRAPTYGNIQSWPTPQLFVRASGGTPPVPPVPPPIQGVLEWDVDSNAPTWDNDNASTINSQDV